MDKGMTITGEGIALFRLLTLRQGVLLEARTGGKFKLTRGPSCTARVKRELGLKRNTSRDNVLLAIDQAIEAQRTQIKPGDIEVHDE